METLTSMERGIVYSNTGYSVDLLYTLIPFIILLGKKFIKKKFITSDSQFSFLGIFPVIFFGTLTANAVFDFIIESMRWYRILYFK